MAAQKGRSYRNAVSVLQVTEAVKFLASKVPEPPDLRRQPLGDLVEDVLTQHFFTPVLQDLKRRQQLGKLHQVGLPVPSCVVCVCVCMVFVLCMSVQAPNAVFGLYNSRMLKSNY